VSFFSFSVGCPKSSGKSASTLNLSKRPMVLSPLWLVT
jgi:hypothetical protein